MGETLQGLKIINIVVALVLLVLLLVAGGYLKNLLNQKPVTHESMILFKSDPECELDRHDCIAVNNNRTVELHLTKPVKYLTQFDIKVITTGFTPQPIEKMTVDFSMLDMQMGINRFALHRQQADVWGGMAMLPVCVSGRKDWQVKLEFADAKSHYIALYKLTLSN